MLKILIIITAACALAGCAAPPSPQPADSPLEGLRLRYLIGADDPGRGEVGALTVVSYSAGSPVQRGLSGAYVNLLAEEGRPARYGPYLRSTDTARRYGEGVPDPAGSGWELNLRDQLARRREQGFRIVGDLDNPDAFSCATIGRAYRVVAEYAMRLVAKNPGLGCAARDGAEARDQAGTLKILELLARADAMIVERGAGEPDEMDALRIAAGKPRMQVWFVAYGDGRGWVNEIARQARLFHNMRATYSVGGEYTNSTDVEARNVERPKQ